MNRSRRLTSYFLIFLFGFLSIKNLFSNLNHSENCEEFGHIHQTQVHDTHVGLHTHNHDDEDCHGSKSVFGYSLFPAVVFEMAPIIYKINYEVVFNLENNFATPFLEPDRKPPRV